MAREKCEKKVFIWEISNTVRDTSWALLSFDIDIRTVDWMSLKGYAAVPIERLCDMLAVV